MRGGGRQQMWGGRGACCYPSQQAPPRHWSCPIRAKSRKQLGRTDGGQAPAWHRHQLSLGNGASGELPGSATQPYLGNTSAHLGDSPCCGVTAFSTEGSEHHPGGRSGSPQPFHCGPCTPDLGSPTSPASHQSTPHPAPQAGAACHTYSFFLEDIFSSSHPESPFLPPPSPLV